MTTLYKSKTGEVGSLEYWNRILDKFWHPFTSSKTCTDMRLPTRPADAWDRFAKVVGLEEIADEN